MTSRLADEKRESGWPGNDTSGDFNVAMQGVVDRVGEWVTAAGKTISERPGASLGAALAVGVILGWWMKRT